MFSERRITYRSTFLALSLVFFLVHVMHLFTDEFTVLLGKEVERKLSFAFLPFIWFNAVSGFTPEKTKQVMSRFSILTFGIGVFLVLYALYRYIQYGDASVFFYHDLASPIDANAIYFSLLLLMSLVFISNEYLIAGALGHLIALIIGAIILVLLASKLFVVLLGVLLFYLIIRKRLLLVGMFTITGLFSLVLFTDGSTGVMQRFKEIDLENALNTKKEITKSTRFDGLSFRVELMDMGMELITENTSALVFGVGPGNAQLMLDKKIENRNMYVGDPKRGDSGYKGYNFHNQYMQTLVETGLLGLLSLLVLLGYLIISGVRSKHWLLVAVNVMFMVSFITESYLSRQIGIVAFIGFNALLSGLGSAQNSSGKEENKSIYA